MSEETSAKPGRRTASYVWKQALILNFSAALAAGFIVVLLEHPTRRQDIVEDFARSFVYAFVIGSMITMSFHHIPWSRWRIYSLGFPLNWVAISSVILACAIAGSLVADLIFLVFDFLPRDGFWNAFRNHAPFCAIIALIFGGGAFAYEVVRGDLEATALALRTKQLDEERARSFAVEAQLASLESHVRPHFLFNTLNTISALIPDDPGQAEVLVGKLAAVLRLSLDSNLQRLTPLERELKLVRDYLEIERARFGNRLRFEMDVPAYLQSVEVPAFSLQTLVENSVKYAVAPRLEGGLVRIAASERGGIIHLRVSDDGPGFTAEAIRPGHGLANLQDRLKGLFGADAKLNVARMDGLTSVSLSIPRPKIKATG